MNARDAYLAAVRRAEIFIWLAAGETTPAVVEEVEPALSRGIPSLAFRLPAPERDVATIALVERVRQDHKTTDVVDLADLDVQLTQGLNDLLLGGGPGTVGLG